MGVVSLLYLVNNSIPDIDNSVQDLRKKMDNENEENLYMLYRVMKYINKIKIIHYYYENN